MNDQFTCEYGGKDHISRLTLTKEPGGELNIELRSEQAFVSYVLTSHITLSREAQIALTDWLIRHDPRTA